MKNLALLQTVATDYRKKLFDTLSHKLNNRFTLFAGDDYFEETVKTDDSIEYLKHVNNVYLLQRKFLVQFDMWEESLKADVLVIEMNPRILSNWLLLLTRKLIGKKTVLWGHAWPRNGQNSRSDKIRHVMRKLGDTIVTYTKSQAEELRLKMPDKKIVYAVNSLYYKDEMIVSNSDISSINNIIYVGRLTEKKKPMLLLDAFIEILDSLPNDTKLIIVGDGEERGKMGEKVKNLGLQNRVELLGHIGDYEILKNLYANALVSVSPGYVGLSITQSFGFGVPMLISKYENHSPEIEVAIDGKNSLFFETDSVNSLGTQILKFYSNKQEWVNKRHSICNFCKENYSIESMSQTFLDLL
jgi:glycosyltransferase involved in cell wall biosynthesis